jgi:two-component system response regulator FixJ
MPLEIIHVVDDDEAARDSLAFLLQSVGFTVKSYASATAFLIDLPALPTGCLITDLRMPELDGLQLLRELRRRHVEMPVLIITGHGDIPLAVEAMRAGALDFLEKPFDDQALLASVRAAFASQQEQSRQTGQKSEIAARIEQLSTRERQVLEGLIAGHPNKVIAYDLGISIRTIEIYRANVMNKMRATSLSDLIRMTMTVPLPPPPRQAAE